MNTHGCGDRSGLQTPLYMPTKYFLQACKIHFTRVLVTTFTEDFG